MQESSTAYDKNNQHEDPESLGYNNSSMINDEAGDKIFPISTEEGLSHGDESPSDPQLKQMTSILRWMQERQQEKDEKLLNKENWDFIARKIDSFLFPIFLVACIALTVTCILVVLPQI